jgi:hypothetical protein
MCGAASAFTCARPWVLAGASPRGFKEPRERGRQTTAIRFCNKPAIFRRPRAVVCQAEGATTASTSFGSRPAAFRAPGYHRPRPLAAALHSGSGSAADEGRPCVPLLGVARPRSQAPESEESYPHDRRTNGKRACLNRAPTLPHIRRSAAASLVPGKVWEVWGRI